MSERLLDVSGLTTRFHTEDGTVTAVNDFSFHLDRGESRRRKLSGMLPSTAKSCWSCPKKKCAKYAATKSP